jgi:hypothetical protein
MELQHAANYRRQKSEQYRVKARAASLPKETIGYLRDLAHRCTRLAHRCPDLGVSQELEGIGTVLMEEAYKLEQSEKENMYLAA